MSNQTPQNNSNNEEVDLGQLFNAIGRLFDRFFSFIGKIFIGLFSLCIYALKPLVKYFKIIVTVILISGLVGFILEKFQEPVYVSDMLVKPYFDSKYQLTNNVDYFNALIGSENYSELSDIFEIDSSTAKELLGFKLEIGPETKNDLFKEYNDYLETIDSTLAKEVTYEDYVDNRNVYSGTTYIVSARSNLNDVFTRLEKGFEKTLKNDYSKKQKSLRDSTLVIKTKAYKEELKRIDSLQKIYLEVLKTESESGKLAVGVEGMMSIKQRTTTREYDLFMEELKIRDSLKSFQEQLVVKNDYYDILSGFDEVGRVDRSIWKKYSFLLPLLSMSIIIAFFIAYKIFVFIKNYER